MSLFGLILVLSCSMSAACSSIMMRMGVDRAGGFVPSFQSLSSVFAQPVFVIGVLLYGVAGIGWLRVIATEQLSVAYPILVSLTFVVVTMGSILLFNETLGGWKLIGMGLIILGIALVAR